MSDMICYVITRVFEGGVYESTRLIWGNPKRPIIMADGKVSKKKPSFLVSWGQRDRTEGKTLSLHSAGPDQSSAPHWPIFTVTLEVTLSRE